MKDYKYMKKGQLIAECENMALEIGKLKDERGAFPAHIAWLLETANSLLTAARMLTEGRSSEEQGADLKTKELTGDGRG